MASVKVSKHELTEIKTLANPPAHIKLIIEAIATLLGEDKHKVDNWEENQKLLSKTTLCDQLASYDVKQATPERVARAKEILQQCGSAEEMKKKSRAAEILYHWVEDVVKNASAE